LIELILVMAILVIVIAVSAPSLSRFFRGRALDSEAKRFLALTRYGQSRAVSEGIPVLLWIDAKGLEYGLRADSSYTEQDTKAVEFQLNKDVQIEVLQSRLAQREATVWKGGGGLATTLPKIRFTPDGFISPSSPEQIVLRQGDAGEVWIAPSQNHLNYEIQTNELARVLRR
jgi:type II secretion system protein H